jgi:hypothetical protein
MNKQIVKGYYNLALSLGIIILVLSLIVSLFSNHSNILLGLIILLNLAFYCILIVLKYILKELKVFE